MTAHETYRDQLLDLAYGELGRREARALRAHLEECADCRAELARMTATRSAMSALPAEPAPERGESVLVAVAREAARERRRKPLVPAWIWGASVGAVGVAAVALLAVRLSGQVRPPGSHPDETALVSRSLQEEAPRPAAVPGPAPSAPAERDARRELAGNAGGEVVLRRVEPPRPQAAPKRKDADAFGGKGRPDRALEREPEPDEVTKGVVGAPPMPTDAAPAAAPAKAAKPAAPAAAPPPAQARAAEAPAPAPPRGFAEPPAGAAGLAADAAGPEALEKKEVASARTRSAAPKVRSGPSGAEDAVARYERLRAAGGLHAASASFHDCPGESSREVERDDQGRVVKVTRRGVLNGTPFTAEQFYGEDGLLEVVRYRAGGTLHEVRPERLGAVSAPGAEVPASALEPRRAGDADLDAPPRCE